MNKMYINFLINFFVDNLIFCLVYLNIDNLQIQHICFQQQKKRFFLDSIQIILLFFMDN